MKKILIIGAGFLQAFVIKKAKQLGYITLAVDMDPDAAGFKIADGFKVINIIDKKACLKYAMDENIDGVLTAATDYGVLTAAYISEKMGLPGIPYKVAEIIKNKYLVRKCLYENHVDDTEQAYEINRETNLDKIENGLEYPVIIKPCDGSGSRGTSRVDNRSEISKACKLAIESSLTNKALIESFIVGTEYGAESLVCEGEIHVLSIMKKWMTDPPFYAELGHAIPAGLPEDIEKKAVKCVTGAIKALGIKSGSVNMDMIITDSGKIHIIDIGARMGGNMIGPCIVPYGTGIDYMQNMIRTATGDIGNYAITEKTAVASKLIAFKQNGVVKAIPDFNIIEKDFDVEIYHHMKIGDSISAYHNNLDGLGYIIVKRATVDEAEKVAEIVLKMIEYMVFS